MATTLPLPIVRAGKMTTSEYRMLHYWVEKQLGRPQHCVICGTTEKRRYHWANISGEYKKDKNDWRRLCVPCHSTEKHLGQCKHGHEYTPENTYTKPNGTHACRTCRKTQQAISNLKSRNRRKLA